VGGGIVFIPVIIFLFHIPPVAALKIALSSQPFGISSGVVGRIQKGVVPLSALKVTGPGLLYLSRRSNPIILKTVVAIVAISDGIVFIVQYLIGISRHTV